MLNNLSIRNIEILDMIGNYFFHLNNKYWSNISKNNFSFDELISKLSEDNFTINKNKKYDFPSIFEVKNINSSTNTYENFVKEWSKFISKIACEIFKINK